MTIISLTNFALTIIIIIIASTIITLTKYRCDILAVTETWLTSTVRIDDIDNEGYDCVMKDKPMEMEGYQGVGLYVKHGIPYKPKPDIGNRLMATTGELNRPKQKSLLITVLYRHPRTCVDFFKNLNICLLVLTKLTISLLWQATLTVITVM